MSRPAETTDRILKQPAFDERTFEEPWQAQAFALVVSLRDRGLFTWTEWSDALALESARIGDGEATYAAWLATLETLLVRQRVTTPESLVAWRDAWDDAARATPHGRPIVVRPPPAD